MERNSQNYNRNFAILLYPEDKNHMKALDIIKQNFDYAYCLHNRDVDENGEIKKEHIHCVIRIGANPNWRTAIAKKLEIKENYIEGCKLDNMLKYLIHFDNPEKYQYGVEEVKGNLKNRLMEIIEKETMSETERAYKITEFIINNNIKYVDLVIWTLKNGLWTTFKRSSNVFIKLLDDKRSNKL